MSSNQSIELYENLKQLTKAQFGEVCFYLQEKPGRVGNVFLLPTISL